MASENTPNNSSSIYNLLAQRRINEALEALSIDPLLKMNPQLADLIQSQDRNYRFLLHYLAKGVDDPSRNSMVNEIVSSLLFANDALFRLSRSSDSPELYYSTLRLNNVRHNSVENALRRLSQTFTDEGVPEPSNRKDFDTALADLFDAVWTMFSSQSASYRLLADALADAAFPFEGKAQIISALLLGNLMFFDRKAFNLLLDFLDSGPDPKLAARTLVTIIFILGRHRHRVALDSSLTARLSLWEDNVAVYRQLRETVMQIIKSHDTQRISDKMKNEVLPGLMKLKPEIINRLKSISEEADLEMLEANPEWEDLLAKNGIGDKLKELTDIQMEGGDVMMMAFSNLKNFPFFSKVSNWFLPFSADHSDVAASPMGQSQMFTQLLDMEGVMCNSDKFSFAFSLARMPGQQREAMFSKMKGQMDQLQEALAERRLKSSIPRFDAEATRFVRDCYRFFKLFGRKNEFADPFATPFDFMSLPSVGTIMSDKEILTLVGEFYFKRGYYKEALPMLVKLDSPDNEDSLLWEKIGYCHATLGNPSKSIEWYRKAELIHPDSQWLLKKMAMTYHLLGKPTLAAEYFTKALEQDSENESLLLSTANTLIESGEPEKALKHLYHLDYLKPDSPSVWRSIASAETAARRFDKALEYYDRLKLSEASSPRDWWESGSLRFIAGDIPGALADYRLAIKTAANDGKFNFEEHADSTRALLEKYGADLDTWSLLVDHLRFPDKSL